MQPRLALLKNSSISILFVHSYYNLPTYHFWHLTIPWSRYMSTLMQYCPGYPYYLQNFRTPQAAVVKLQFKRKGSWVRLRRNWPPTILTRFGHSRPLTLNIAPYGTLRFKKHLFYHGLVFTFFSKKSPQKILQQLSNIRPLNHYTLRGIRTARFFLKRRPGKISQYKRLKSKIF